MDSYEEEVSPRPGDEWKGRNRMYRQHEGKLGLDVSRDAVGVDDQAVGDVVLDERLEMRMKASMK
jgi:hypothetical protein